MHSLEKLLAKKAKEGKELDPLAKKAKMGVLEELKKHMSDDMAGNLHGLKKVSVASDSKEGLTAGLDKAKEILSGAPGHAGEEHAEPMGDEEEHEFDHDANPGRNDRSPAMLEHESHESEDEQAKEHTPGLPEHDEEEAEHEVMASGDDEDMDEEELDKRLAHLMSKKEKLRKKGQ